MINGNVQPTLRKIQADTLGTRIGYHDTVSGAFFHKFVTEYHAYDRRQKEIIKRMQEENEQLKQDRDRYMYALASMTDCTEGKKSRDPKAKLRRQKSVIAQLILQNVELKKRLQEVKPH